MKRTQIKTIALVLCLIISLIDEGIAQKGDWLWHKTGIPQRDGCLAAIFDIYTDIHNNTYVLGRTTDTFSIDGHAFNKIYTYQNGFVNNRAMFVVKFSESGNVVWSKYFEDKGSVDGIIPWNIVADKIGNVYVSAGISDSTNFDAELQTGKGSIILKLDASSGAVVYSQKLYDERFALDFASSLAIDATNCAYVGFNFKDSISWNNSTVLTSTSGSDVCIFRVRQDGQLSWVKSFSGIGNQEIRGVGCDSYNNFYVSGYFDDSLIYDGYQNSYSNSNSHFFTSKIDTNGNIIWLKSWGNADVTLESMYCDSNGNMLIVGSFYKSSVQFENVTLNSLMPGGMQYFVSKFDSSGNLEFAKPLWGGVFDPISPSIRLGKRGDIVLAGNCMYDSIVISGTNIQVQDSAMMFAVFDSVGNFKYLNTIRTVEPAYCAPTSIAEDNLGNFYFGGFFSGLCLGENIAFGNSSQTINPFLIKMGNYGLSIDFLRKTDIAVSIYPNPNNGNFNVAIKEGSYKLLRVVDQFGRTIFTNTVETQNEIRIPNAVPGIYYLQLLGEESSVTKKIIIQ